jgi:hypothetical protein
MIIWILPVDLWIPSESSCTDIVISHAAWFIMAEIYSCLQGWPAVREALSNIWHYAYLCIPVQIDKSA